MSVVIRLILTIIFIIGIVIGSFAVANFYFHDTIEKEKAFCLEQKGYVSGYQGWLGFNVYCIKGNYRLSVNCDSNGCYFEGGMFP